MAWILSFFSSFLRLSVPLISCSEARCPASSFEFIDHPFHDFVSQSSPLEVCWFVGGLTSEATRRSESER